jgi:hypothetical protein
MAEKIIFQKHDYSRTEVGHHIYDMLQQITVDMESAQRELEGTDDDIHLHALQIIEMGLFFATDDDFGGRFYSNMTGLLSGSKKYLRVDGQPLHHIDIKNSQPLFLGLVMKQEGIPGIEEYLEAVINGKLYELISDKAGYTLSYGAEAGRKIVKDHIRQKILFAKESASDVLLTKFVFKELFPAVIEYIAASKQGVQQHSKKKKKDVGVDLAHKLQTMEREFIIDRCCTRIMKERPDMWFTTIHDCILYKPEDAPYVVGVVKEEFAKLGISPIVEDKPVN